MSRALEMRFERFRRHGDVAALGQVFDATAPQLRRVARHLTRDPVEAEDLVQATFLAAIEKRATFDASRELSPWLTGILLKQASLARRARARVIDPDRLGSQVSENPLDVAAARELSEALTVALARLSADDRDVLIPLLLHGRQAVEIARELGRRPNTIHMRIQRGLARLRLLLPASFAVAALLRSSEARGLRAVRAEVLRRARLDFPAATATSAGATALGILMSSRQIAVAIALVLGLGLAGYLVASSSSGADPQRGTPVASAPTLLDASDIEAPRGPATDRTLADSSALASPADASGSALELRILRADGEAAALALVALVDAEGRVTRARADAEGRCTFASGTGTGHVYVRDDGALPHHTPIELAAGRRTVELPRGADFSGRIAMTSGEKLPPIELSLTPDSAPEGLAQAGIAVFRALELVERETRKVVARTTSGADGTFRFRGLDAGWSGALTLPGELVFVDGALPTRSSTRQFPRVATGLELPVAWRPRIVGRLVDAATRAPIADAAFDTHVQFFGGNGLHIGSRTRSDGRFVIPLESFTNAVELTVEEVFTPHGWARGGDATWKTPSDPFDAGDVACHFPTGRPLSFRVVDPQGAPVRGARAYIAEIGFVTGDDRGEGRFDAVPDAIDQAQFGAPGHALAQIALTPATTSPIEVVLAPANRLTVVLPRECVGRRDLQLEMVGPELTFGPGGARWYVSDLRGPMVGRINTWDAGSLKFSFDDEGRLELEGVPPGIPFRLRLVGWSGPAQQSLAEIALDPMGTEEQRRVDLTLDPRSAHGVRVLNGRAIDEQGRPVFDAGIELEIGREGLLDGRTRLDGTFRMGLADREKTDVEITKRGYVPFRVRGFDLTAGKTLEATLRRGRDLRVELVDAKGRPIQARGVWGMIEGFGIAGTTEEVRPGVYVLGDVPVASTKITARVGDVLYEHVHESAADVARFVLPEHGSLVVSWTLDVEWPKNSDWSSKSYQLALRSLGGTNDHVLGISWNATVGETVFESALPGEYTIGFEVGARATRESAPAYVPLGAPRRVTITGGETTRIDL